MANNNYMCAEKTQLNCPYGPQALTNNVFAKGVLSAVNGSSLPYTYYFDVYDPITIYKSLISYQVVFSFTPVAGNAETTICMSAIGFDNFCEPSDEGQGTFSGSFEIGAAGRYLFVIYCTSGCANENIQFGLAVKNTGPDTPLSGKYVSS